jgi:GH15 family glucan-1,4-alpha-glucosidase
LSYLPIEDHGVIGDMHTVALVGKNGTIDWMCFPRFDSPSIFASLLDDAKGGYFQIAPTLEGTNCKQMYWPDTNVLVSRFLSAEGVGEIVDLMPIERPGKGSSELIRRVRVVRGSMGFCVECRPAFNFARDPHRVTIVDTGATFHSPSLSLRLLARIPLEADPRGGVTARFSLHEGESTVFLLQQDHGGDDARQALDEQEANELFEKTVGYWRRWMARCTYRGRWREMVHRSALVLKLLTYAPTGAIVAAPTSSLPELVGGERNWDYRFTWVRDAAFTLYALMRIGFSEEAAAFMNWIEARCQELEPDGSLQIMYGIDGRHKLVEHKLSHLAGYSGSQPVRIGNGAYRQHQLDIYGELMDSVYLYNKYGSPISYDLWQNLRHLLDWVCDNWHREDHGIWETRGGARHFVYSKVMCWVALDRGLRLAEKRSFPASHDRWLKCRDAIYEEVQHKGWNAKRQAFVQSYGSESLDAANLIMPLVFFLSPTDPRMLATIDSINRSPSKGGLASDSLVLRYNSQDGMDGLKGEEGSFNMCTFWLVEALTRSRDSNPKNLHQAQLLFEQILGYANHLGLFAEETGPRGEALGNFPQALTHLALISSAFNLDRALGKSGAG